LYVLARHHKMCKLVNWSRSSNITSFSCTPGRATEEQANQKYTREKSQAPNYPIGALGRKRLISAQCLQVTIVCPSQEKQLIWLAHSMMA
jgi:hypothetical protein